MISGQLVFGPPAHSAFFAPAQVQQKLLVRPFPRLQQTQTRTPRSCAQPYTAEHAQRKQQQRAGKPAPHQRSELANSSLLPLIHCASSSTAANTIVTQSLRSLQGEGSCWLAKHCCWQQHVPAAHSWLRRRSMLPSLTLVTIQGLQHGQVSSA